MLGGGGGGGGGHGIIHILGTLDRQNGAQISPPQEE
jgi:hypothetical protein